MTTHDTDAQQKTRRLRTKGSKADDGDAGPVAEAPLQDVTEQPPIQAEYAPASPEPVYEPFEATAPPPYAYPYEPQRPSEVPESVLYVPLAVTVGDGFKFGCGFFMAAVAAILVGFVVVAAFFLLSSLTGITLPIGQ